MGDIRDKLKQVGTATVTTVLFKRGLRNAFMQGPRSVRATALHMVGKAYTLRFIPAREDLDKMMPAAPRSFRRATTPSRRTFRSAAAAWRSTRATGSWATATASP